MPIYLALAGVESLADTVDLLVHLRSVMVALLTGAGNGELDAGRMPRADTSDLAQTLVRLAGQLASVPTRGDTCRQKETKRSVNTQRQ